MVGISENEAIRYEIVNAQGIASSTGTPRQYDVFFTDNGIALVVVASGWKTMARVAGAASFGVVGAAVAGAYSGNVKVREQFQGLNISQILQLNEKSFFVPYGDIEQIEVRKTLLGMGRINLKMTTGKFQLDFSKDQLDIAEAAAFRKLGNKLHR